MYNRKVVPCGLFCINNSFNYALIPNYLAASSDGLVDNVLVEVKCPYL